MKTFFKVISYQPLITQLLAQPSQNVSDQRQHFKIANPHIKNSTFISIGNPHIILEIFLNPTFESLLKFFQPPLMVGGVDSMTNRQIERCIRLRSRLEFNYSSKFGIDVGKEQVCILIYSLAVIFWRSYASEVWPIIPFCDFFDCCKVYFSFMAGVPPQNLSCDVCTANLPATKCW